MMGQTILSADLQMMQNWERWLSCQMSMKFKILSPRSNNMEQQYTLGLNQLERNFPGKVLEVPVKNKLIMSQPRVPEAKTNRLLGSLH